MAVNFIDGMLTVIQLIGRGRAVKIKTAKTNANRERKFAVMQIGEVIRKYRKNKNMTQEEMAGRLGVTAPAVNKWENGNSMPDITFLAPIARLLGITVDELLSFREELTREEINGLVNELSDRLKKGSYGEVFSWAKKIMEEYPNCEWLIWQMAVVLDAQRMFNKVPDIEQYEDYLCDCYIRVLASSDEQLRRKAADSLFGFYTRKEQWEKAEAYLAYFPSDSPEQKRKQAYLYSKTGRLQEAYKAYEEILFSGYQMTSMVLHSMHMLAIEEKNWEKARYYVEKEKQMAVLFERGEYTFASAGLELAAAMQDADAVIAIMEQTLGAVDTVAEWVDSSLYGHMAFKRPGEQFAAELKKKLVENFREEEGFGFLRGDKRYQELMNSFR